MRRGRLVVLTAIASPGLLFVGGASLEGATGGDHESARFFASDAIPRIEIQISDESLTTLRQHFGRRADTSGREDVSATIREGGITYSNVAIHLKGSRGSFRGVDSNPALTLGFDKQVAGQRFHGLEKISLNNSVQDSTFLCERIGRRMFEAAGVPVPRSSYATVRLNGRSLGLHVLVEGWNKQFLKRHFKDAGGNLYEAPLGRDVWDSLEVKSGDAREDHRALARLARAIREPNLTNGCVAFSQVLDVDRFLTFMAVEVMLSHWDGYCLHQNNYRIFHDRAAGRMVFLPHGMDQLFGLRRPERDPPLIPQMSGFVAVAVMETKDGQQRYLDRMAELLSKVFDLGTITNDLRRTAARLRPYVGDESSGFGGFESNVSMLERHIIQRHAYIEGQLAEAKQRAKTKATPSPKSIE